MELIRGMHNLASRHRGCVATMGAFDGVHWGHRAVLKQLIDKGRELALPTVVICFEPLPREFFAPREAPPRLMSFREKLVVLRQLGLDRVLRIRFDERFRSLAAEDFIEQIFVQGLGVRHLVVGDDLRFGAGRRGDIVMLRAAGANNGFEVGDTASVMMDGARVSSSRIRKALEDNDLELAQGLLGYPYQMSGKVVYGRQLGRTLGLPTANLELHRSRAPMSGVYAVDVLGAAGQLVQGVANVGTRPTIGDREKALLEVHLLDFNGDLYGRHIDVIFRHKIREELKFDSIDELKRRIEEDISVARQWFLQHRAREGLGD
jgi:riboflavin kinase/FMN adenylyltransferase